MTGRVASPTPTGVRGRWSAPAASATALLAGLLLSLAGGCEKRSAPAGRGAPLRGGPAPAKSPDDTEEAESPPAEDRDAPGLAGPAFSGTADASAEWPSSRDGLVFLFGTAKDPGLVFGGGDEPAQLWVGYRGFARRDHDYAMLVQNGSFFFDELSAKLLAALDGSTAITIEMCLTPDGLERGPADILSFADEQGAVNLRVTQEKNEIVATLRASATGKETARVRLCRLARAEPCHLVLSCSTYASSVLTCYANGVKTVEREDVSSVPSSWEDLPLYFGSAADRSRDWAGAIEGVAIWRRALSEEEARADFERYSARVAARRPVPTLVVKGKLLTRSTVPEAKRIAPYTRALSVHEYEVEEVVSGDHDGERIRVARWGMFERKILPTDGTPIGGSYRLVLERMDDNPQLASEWLADDLPYDPDVVVYYDTSAPAGQGAPLRSGPAPAPAEGK